MGTIIVSGILFLLIAAAVVKIIKDKKQGKSPCAFCPNSENCLMKGKGECEKEKNG